MKKIIILAIAAFLMLFSYATVKGESTYNIVVNKAYHLLFIENGEEIVHTVPITIGKGGDSETPAGNFSIVSIVQNPKWYFNGKVYAPYTEDPENGLGVCWMGISLPSYGIHGTNEPFSPGRNRSHGCVRMNNSDIKYVSKVSFVEERVKIEEGTENGVATHLKAVNILYDIENFLNNAK